MNYSGGRLGSGPNLRYLHDLKNTLDPYISGPHQPHVKKMKKISLCSIFIYLSDFVF